MLNPLVSQIIICQTVSTPSAQRCKFIHTKYTYQENYQFKLLLQYIVSCSVAKKVNICGFLNSSVSDLEHNLTMCYCSIPIRVSD